VIALDSYRGCGTVRTARVRPGRPVAAVQHLLAAVDDVRQKTGARFDVLGVGTTGSGRKLVGRIVGAALMLADERFERSAFRGVDLHRKRIPIRSEICELCPNHCKLTVADLEYGPVAYGFLCGRDYEAQKRVSANHSGFDLMRAHKEALGFRPRSAPGEITIGLPAALHMAEDLPLWRKFFDELGLRTVTGERDNEALRKGKHAAGAEFCAPQKSVQIEREFSGEID